MRPVKIDRGGPNEYQMLRCHDLEPTPQPESPKQLRRNHTDPFDFYGEETTEELSDWNDILLRGTAR